MKPVLLILSITAALAGTQDFWLDQVSPVITPAEKKLYLALPPEDKRKFQEDFWATKAIGADEYFRRLQYVDSTYGSKKLGSGANTDSGAVYLSLGAPSRVARIPSSRIFVPLEIWYYDTVPGLLNTELRLILYQPVGGGYPKLYSPTVDTIRALLLPQAGTISMFGPNDSTNETAIRQTLKVGTAEDEVITAAANVASGIKYSGNDEILGRVRSPQAMLSRPLRTETQSRFIVSRPKLDVFEAHSNYGGSQIDLGLEVKAQREIDLEVLNGASGVVYRNQLRLKFFSPESLVYTHRLDLLPGSYRLMFVVDGTPYAYALDVHEMKSLGDIVRVNPRDAERNTSPFGFGGKTFELDPEGSIALVPATSRVTWRIRQGAQVIWKSASDSDGQVAFVEFPTTGYAPGTYRLEATTETESRSFDWIVKHSSTTHVPGTVISFNANLTPSLRLALLGRQWLQRGQFEEARKTLQRSLSSGVTAEAEVELARVESLTGDLDGARNRVRRVLAVQHENFDALSVYAYIETQFQDYPVAAQLYKRALAVQESPALRAALAKLPVPQP